MKKNLFIFLSIFFLTLNFVFAKELEIDSGPVKSKPEKPLLMMESKRETRKENTNPEEKPNLLKIYKEENSRSSEPGSEVGKSRRNNPVSCSETKDLIEKRSRIINSNLEKRKALIGRIEQVIGARLSRLSSVGADVTSIQAVLDNYITESKSLIEKKESLITTLATLNNFDCISDPGAFKSTLKEFNLNFRNQNLEFNRLNRDLRLNVFYQINNLEEKYNFNQAPVGESR
jgi:hypothetical protein